MFNFILKILILLLSFITISNSEQLKIFEFTESEFKELKVKKVKKNTNYSLGYNENGNYLRAEAKGVGSGLGKEIEIDLNKTPFINITWKVEKDLSGIDEKSKKSHDYAARVFVIKKMGFTPLSNKAINYVFSSNNSINDNWRSPYTKNSIDYVLSTTKNNLNQWISVKANVKDHFKKLHNLEIDKLDGVALMTDTDQTNIRAISYYQNIYFSSE